MKKITKVLLVALLLSPFHLSAHLQTPPKLTVVIIADQFAYHYIEKLKKHFKYGLKEFLDYGVCYENAYHAHGNPETAPGHHALSTGVLPKDHGISGNKWFDEENKKIRYTSPAQTMVDGLSDQFMMKSNENSKHHVFSFSLKDRGAIGTANKLGKAFWFDSKVGFITSNDYYQKAPGWLEAFNKEKDFNALKEITWNTAYPQDSPAYQFPHIKNYDNAAFKYSMIEKKNIDISDKKANEYKNHLFRVPASSQFVFDAAKACIKHNLKKDSTDRMLLWLSLSNLDLLCHFYGPDSLEVTDLIYHLDKQIYDFMKHVRSVIDDKDILFAFSADHGIQPIQEIVKLKGLKNARRIMAKPLIKKLNATIKNKHNVDDIVLSFSSTYFFLDHKKLLAQEEPVQKKILRDLKKLLIKEPGVRNAWTKEELKKACFEPHQKEQFYKNQIYKNRIGDIICMPDPYCLITNYPTGCSHSTPYDYDTHVPLILLRKGMPHKTIRQKVFIPQLPVTLARLLDVSRPSASTFDLLPGIFS